MLEIMRYADARDVIGTKSTLDALVSATKQDSDLKKAVRAAEDPNERKALKLKLPMWYTCGTINGHVSEENIIPAGVVQLDLDGASEDAERLSELKLRFAAIPCVLFAAVSASGRGVYALAKVPVSVQTSKDAQKAFLDIIQANVIYDARDGEHLDDACAKSAQRRFESYDPSPYYNPNAEEYEPDYRKLCDEAFKQSVIRQLAGFLGGYGAITPGCAQTGLALALAAVQARGRVEGKYFDANSYVCRSQVVILGESGAGKTNLLNVVEEVVQELGGRILNAGSDRCFEQLVTETAAEIVGYDKKENSKGALVDDKSKPIWKVRKEPIPGVGIFDEAGDEQKSRSGTWYKGNLNALRRRMFNRTFTPGTTMSTALPQLPLRPSYTDIQCSTPKAWAHALCGADTTKGEGRRVLEFWLDRPEVPEALSQSRVARMAVVATNPPAKSDPVFVRSILESMPPALGGADERGISLSLSGTFNLWENSLAYSVLEQMHAPESADLDAPTVVGNLATLLAYTRGSVSDIEKQDVRAAWAIYFAVLDNRVRLSDRADIGVDTFKTQITSAILGYIGKHDGQRYADTLRAFNKRGFEYKQEFERLIKDGAVTVYKDGAVKRVRLATDEEAAAAAEKRAEMDFSEERKNRDKVDHGEEVVDIKPRRCVPEPQKDALKYDECDEAEKRLRLDSYLDKHNVSNPLHQGNIDKSLASLAGKLRNIGMNDAVAEGWLRELCEALGHTKKKDQDRIVAILTGKRYGK